eukprot:5924440-Amphidinium_carterae.1
MQCLNVPIPNVSASLHHTITIQPCAAVTSTKPPMCLSRKEHCDRTLDLPSYNVDHDALSWLGMVSKTTHHHWELHKIGLTVCHKHESMGCGMRSSPSVAALR